MIFSLSTYTVTPIWKCMSSKESVVPLFLMFSAINNQPISILLLLWCRNKGGDNTKQAPPVAKKQSTKQTPRSSRSPSRRVSTVRNKRFHLFPNTLKHLACNYVASQFECYKLSAFLSQYYHVNLQFEFNWNLQLAIWAGPEAIGCRGCCCCRSIFRGPSRPFLWKTPGKYLRFLTSSTTRKHSWKRCSSLWPKVHRLV